MGAEKVALVTGAGRRLGRHIALHLGKRGYAVAVHYHRSAAGARRTAAQIRKSGGRAVPLKADLSRVGDIRVLVTAVKKKLGAITLLVNSAARFDKIPWDSVTPEKWRHILDTNLASVFFLSRFAAKQMTKKGGVIINIEDALLSKPRKGYVPYLVSKAGVACLTRLLAMELAPGIRVCGISPGPVLMPESYPPALRKKILKTTLLGKEGSAADIANAVTFLAEDANYVTGVTLPVDGGLGT